MGVNKVVYGGNTLIDLSADTVAANKMLAGITGHDKAGNPITGNIPSQAAQTITPGTADKTIAAGKYLSGKQTIKGDANLKAANIAKGVSIFGVTGTHEGGEDVSAETAEYTSLLTDLETAIDALPDAGSGGGSGSVDTCTVSLTGKRWSIPYLSYTTSADGEIKTEIMKNVAYSATNDLTCVKGTRIIILENLASYSSGLMYVQCTGDITFEEAVEFHTVVTMLTFLVNGDGTITVTDDS